MNIVRAEIAGLSFAIPVSADHAHICATDPGALAPSQRASSAPTSQTVQGSVDDAATRQEGSEMKPWLTVVESAEYAGVSRDTIYTACERKELRHARVCGRRSIRLKAEWIDAWLERHAPGVQDRHAGDHGAMHGGVS
jgi:excisionase family DNA binding protein